MVEPQAGIPLLMKPLSGHSSDAQDFGEAVRAHVQQWHITYGLTYLVADSALYSAANLQKLAQTHIKWITRVPATVSTAQAVLAQARPPAPGIAHSRLSLSRLPQATAGLSNVGCASMPNSARHRPAAPSTRSGASRVTKNPKPFSHYAAPPVPVKPMPGRPFQPYGQLSSWLQVGVSDSATVVYCLGQPVHGGDAHGRGDGPSG